MPAAVCAWAEDSDWGRRVGRAAPELGDHVGLVRVPQVRTREEEETPGVRVQRTARSTLHLVAEWTPVSCEPGLCSVATGTSRCACRRPGNPEYRPQHYRQDPYPDTQCYTTDSHTMATAIGTIVRSIRPSVIPRPRGPRVSRER